MNVMAQPLQRFDLQGLVAAIAHAQAEDRLEPTLSAAQWDALNGYLQPHGLVSGEILFDRGAQDRTVFLVESGTLSVHLEDDKGRLKLAMIGPGGVVGEGAFFSHRPRSATVQANSACQLWMLSAVRFSELAHRQPAIALALAMGFGSVQARRLANRRRRFVST
ncbi:MAG: cyclic nucleotide-binding domain-containing protein [Curvibacter sp.]|nr:cyclic nucleotide-binding domain-containing protein [Curvibacter sp.]